MAKGHKPSLPSSQIGKLPSARQLEQQIAQVHGLLASETVTVTAGGGALKMVMTGDQKCQSIEIAPDFLNSTEPELIADLLKSAINQGLEASRDLAARKLGTLTGGFPSF